MDKALHKISFLALRNKNITINKEIFSLVLMVQFTSKIILNLSIFIIIKYSKQINEGFCHVELT